MTKIKAFLYGRFSSSPQELGDSERRQTELAKAFCIRNNLELVLRLGKLELFDRGFSGFDAEHVKSGAFGKLMIAIKTNQIEPGSYLLVENLDRLSREIPVESMSHILNILKAKINLVTLCPEHTYTITDDFGLILAIVETMRSNKESARKSDMSSTNWAQKRHRIKTEKMTARCPAWLKLSDDRKYFICVADRVAIIKRIFAEKLQGFGKRKIAQRLNEDGLDVWGCNGRKSDGWRESYVDKILHSPAVIGEFTPHTGRGNKRVTIGAPVKDYYPAIIDKKIFQKVQLKKYTSHAGPVGSKVANLFSGLVKDGYSGSAMTYTHKGTTKRLGSEKWSYLKTDATRKNSRARRCSWHYPSFEILILNYLVHVDWATVKGRPETSREALNVDILKNELIELDAKISKLIELATTTEVPIARLTQELKDRQLKRDEKSKQLELAEAGSHLQTAAASVRQSDIIELVTRGDVDARYRLREELRALIDKIELYPEGMNLEQGKQISDEFTRNMATSGAAFCKILFRQGVVRWLFQFSSGKSLVLDEHTDKSDEAKNRFYSIPEGGRVKADRKE